MTLDMAILLLVVAGAGIVLAYRYLRKKPKLRIICLVLFCFFSTLPRSCS